MGVALDDADLGVQKVEHARGRGHGALVQIEGLAQPSQRPQQALGDEHDNRVGAQADPALGGEPATHQHVGGEGEQDGHADQRDERGRQPDRLAVGVAVGLGGLADPAGLALLGGERLDRGDAVQVVVEDGVHLADLLAHLGVAHPYPALVHERAGHDDGHGDDGEDGDLRGHREHDRADHDHRGRHVKHVRCALVEEALELVDVVVHDRHQPARALL